MLNVMICWVSVLLHRKSNGVTERSELFQTPPVPDVKEAFIFSVDSDGGDWQLEHFHTLDGHEALQTELWAQKSSDCVRKYLVLW